MTSQSPYKVLAVHNYYRERGGEDQAFDRETAMLERHGHEVIQHTVHNDNVDAIGQLRMAAGTIWNRTMFREIQALTRKHSPDIVHFHNFLPLVSPAAHHAAAAGNAAVVQTLHNFRLLCPNALFFRDGHVCETCAGRMFQWPGIVHRCYRGSTAASAVVAGMNSAHRVIGTWKRQTDALIALSAFSRQKFIDGGLPEPLIHVKPNFIPLTASAETKRDSPVPRSALFVGRLSPEKGIRLLVDAWRHLDASLTVVGTGPLDDELRSSAPANVSFLGQLDSEHVLAEMAKAQILVFPSECYENMSQVLVEALSKGLPIVASRIGGVPEIIEDGKSGILFEPGNTDALKAAVSRTFADQDTLVAMRQGARQRYESRYSEPANYAALVGIYDAARENAEKRKPTNG